VGGAEGGGAAEEGEVEVLASIPPRVVAANALTALVKGGNKS